MCLPKQGDFRQKRLPCLIYCPFSSHIIRRNLRLKLVIINHNLRSYYKVIFDIFSKNRHTPILGAIIYAEFFIFLEILKF